MRRFWLSMVVYYISDFAALAFTAKWLKVSEFKWLLGAFVAYTTCTAVWLWGLTSQSSPNMANALSIYSVVSVIPAIAVALVCTGDKFTARDWLGVVLGIASVLILSAKHKD